MQINKNASAGITEDAAAITRGGINNIFHSNGTSSLPTQVGPDPFKQIYGRGKT